MATEWTTATLDYVKRGTDSYHGSGRGSCDWTENGGRSNFVVVGSYLYTCDIVRIPDPLKCDGPIGGYPLAAPASVLSTLVGKLITVSTADVC